MEVSGYQVRILGGHHFEWKPQAENHWSGGWNKKTPLSAIHPWFPRYQPVAPKTSPLRDTGDYVAMPDSQHYSLQLTNNHPQKATAKVTIDGKYTGTWIIDGLESIVIERPVDMEKKFTFYKRASEGFVTAGLRAGDPKNGLIQVEFTPMLETPKTFSSVARQSATINPQSISDMTPNLIDNLSLGSRQSFSPSLIDNLQREDRNSFLSYTSNSRSASSLNYEEGATALRGRSHQRFRLASIGDLDPSKKVTISVRLVAKPSASTTGNPVPPPISMLV